MGKQSVGYVLLGPRPSDRRQHFAREASTGYTTQRPETAGKQHGLLLGAHRTVRHAVKNFVTSSGSFSVEKLPEGVHKSDLRVGCDDAHTPLGWIRAPFASFASNKISNPPRRTNSTEIEQSGPSPAVSGRFDFHPVDSCPLEWLPRPLGDVQALCNGLRSIGGYMRRR